MPPISWTEAHSTVNPPAEVKAYDPGQDQALQRAIASGQRAQALGYGYDQPTGNVCRQCQSAYAPGQGTKNGRCQHRPDRVALLQQQDQRRLAEQTELLQQAKRNHGKSAALVVDWHREIGVEAMKNEVRALLDLL